jgi:cation diffusion facilitator family transporter
MRFWRSPHDAHSSFHLGKKNAILGAIALSLLAFVLQVIGAWLTGSLALAGDSAHLLTDLVSLLMTLAAVILATRPATEVRSFGLFRLEVLATFVNGILLLGVSLVLLVEGAERVLHPQAVAAGPLAVVAGIGLVFNLLAGFLLQRAAREEGIDFHAGHNHGHEHAHDHGHEHHSQDGRHDCGHHHGQEELDRQNHLHSDRNLQSALLHIWSDALNSVAVIAGALVVQFTGYNQADALVGIGIAYFILRWSWRVIRDAGHVLLEGTPRHIRTTELLQALQGLDSRVREVEDLHVWEITSRMYAATAEIYVAEMSLAQSEELRERLHELLHDRFGIAHVVLAIRPE